MVVWTLAVLAAVAIGPREGRARRGPSIPARAAPLVITIDTAHPGRRLNPNMWGVFFEDINFAADGGLSAELVKNRSFEFADPLMGWNVAGGAADCVTVRTEEPLNPANTHYLRWTATGGTVLENEGFRGMGVRKGEAYLLRAFARRVAVTHAPHAIRVELIAPGGGILGTGRITTFQSRWAPVTTRIVATATEAKARLRLVAEGDGTLDLDMVSLYPAHTWMNRPMGLRADLVQRLADLRPGFVRFPGGCIVEGRYLRTRYQWKKTIGPQETRETLINRWNDEFRHKPAPDYFQSFGLGFMEYFRLCEDIGADPLPVLNCGMACQFNSKELVPLDRLDSYVQDALDLIEFANGPVTTEWGAKRAALGHPKPFHLRLLGVGNEQWGPDYFPRYERFARAVKARYPSIQLVSSAGPSPAGRDFDLAWSTLRAMGRGLVDIVDEHCYAAPDWFLDNAARYDHYSRTGPKVFMGEYAAQSVGIARSDNKNDWGCALAEAAYMTGLERDGDVVRMSSYAPLFAHIDAWQWTPDLIWFDNLRSYATPNYYVQQMFMRNCGDRILPLSTTAVPADAHGKPRFYATAALRAAPREMIVKVVNATDCVVSSRLELPQRLDAHSSISATVLESASLSDVNSFEAPLRVAPQSKTVRTGKDGVVYTFAPESFTVLRIPLNGRR